jgi:hypothetical protein
LEYWSHGFGGFFPPSNNSTIVGDQIRLGSIGFLPHPPALLPEFANFNRGIILAIGNFKFHVRTQGVIRLLDPICSGPSVMNFITSVALSSFVGSSSEVNSQAIIEINIYSTTSLGITPIFSTLSPLVPKVMHHQM